MNTLEKLDRRIVELIHGLPYEKVFSERIEVTDEQARGFYKGCVFRNGRPNTIGRVLAALEEVDIGVFNSYSYVDGWICEMGHGSVSKDICKWKLIKENGEECSTADHRFSRSKVISGLL